MSGQVVPVANEVRNTYMIIRGEDARDLANAVNDAMDRGWSPLGGVIYVPMDPLAAAVAGPQQAQKYLPYWQAMTRE